jgi:choline dehydrogenase-like flavoprotein
LIDARTIPRGTVIQSDVAVVGAGISGLSLAVEFAQAPFSTCLIESGGLKPDKINQSLFWGENVGLPYYALDTTRARVLGGTTHFWKIKLPEAGMAARVQPMDVIDFEARDWVPYSGWPFGRNHLDPFYERAHDICGIGPYNYDPGYWADADKPVMPFAAADVRTSIFQFTDRSVFHNRHRESIARADKIKTLLNANVTDIRTDASGRNITGLQIDCLDGNRFTVEAKVYILALGGIETPRLMLSSDNQCPNGIGNQHGLVGRFFMEHAHLWSGCFVPVSVPVSNATGLYQLHENNGVSIMAKLALSEKTLRREKMTNYCVSIHPDYVLSYDRYISGGRESVAAFRKLRGAFGAGKIPENAMGLLGRIIVDPVAIGRAAYRKAKGAFTEKFKRSEHITVYRLNHMSEQVPNPDSRVTLSNSTDALGMRRVKLDWRLSSLDIHTITRAQEIISAAMQASGLGHLEIRTRSDTLPPKIHGGWHHMGTTRMHQDPKQGVVDDTCRVHGLSNLYVAGASVFPTGGVANPVLTTIAVVLRLADHVKQTLSDRDFADLQKSG